MSDSDRTLERAEQLLQRMSPQAQRLAMRERKRRRAHSMRKLGRVVLAFGAFLVAVGLIQAFAAGLSGTLVPAAFVVTLLAAFFIFMRSPYPQATSEALVQSDLKLLPAQTEVWLSQQRKLLPAPAAHQLDGIGLKLETLAPQLQTLNPAEPVAVEARKILAEHLPELVEGYRKVPEPLRRETPRNGGPTPDEQLADGLRLIDEEIADLTRSIAAGDLDRLATQEKFLQLKYRDSES